MVNIKQKNLRILRLKQVKIKTGMARSTIYQRMQEGAFPRQIQLGPRSVGWLEHEIDEWIVQRGVIRDNS